MTTMAQDVASAMEVSVDTTETIDNEENGAKSARQMDNESRDADDENACLLVEGKTEVCYGLMQLGSRWEGAAETAKRTTSLLNGKSVRDHTAMVTRASALLTGGQHTGLAQFERTMSFGEPLQKEVDGLTIFRGGGIGGSTYYMRFPHGSSVGCFMLDLLTQAEAVNAAARICGGVGKELKLTVEMDNRRFTAPRLDQGEWDKSFAVVFDTEFMMEEIASMMNDAATKAHEADSTHPEAYFVTTDTDVKLSREIVANTMAAASFTNIDKMYSAGSHWTLEESAGVKVQMDEFYVQGLTGFRDARPGGEGRTFLHTVLGKTTECYDIYVHDNGMLKGTGIYAVKPTVQAKYEEEVRCTILRLATQCEKGPLRTKFENGRCGRGFVISVTENEAKERAGLDPWDLGAIEAVLETKGGGNRKALMSEMTEAAKAAAATAAAEAQRGFDAKIKESLEAAAVTQSKLDEMAKAQLEAAEQSKTDKAAHCEMIKATQEAAQHATEQAGKAQLDACRAKEDAMRASKEAQEAVHKAAVQEEKANVALAALANAQAAAEQRHAAQQDSNAMLLALLASNAEIQFSSPSKLKELKDLGEGGGVKHKKKKTAGAEWCAFEAGLRRAGVGVGHSQEFHECLLLVAAAVTGAAIRWMIPAEWRPVCDRGMRPRSAHAPSIVLLAQIDPCTRENQSRHGATVETAAGAEQRGVRYGFSTADARRLADLDRPPRPPRVRRK